MPLPLWTTPEAPDALRVASLTLSASNTVTRRRVAQQSTSEMLALPPRPSRMQAETGSLTAGAEPSGPTPVLALKSERV